MKSSLHSISALSSHLFHLLSLIPILLLAHALFYANALGGDAVDDAYISFRYAQNAILGHGLVFNPGEKVEGFTNFLWTTLMIPLEGAQVDVGRASMALGVLFALLTLWLVIRFAKFVTAARGVGALAALLLAVDGSFALWAVSGLETALFAFLVFAGVVFYIREQSVGACFSFPFSAVFFGLAAMTRPEGLMVFGITVAHQAAWRLMAERRLFTSRDLSRLAVFFALFAPYWLGRWQYYHSFLPNSFHAKVSVDGPQAQVARGWRHLAQFLGVHLGWLVLLPPVVALLTAVLPTSARSLNSRRTTADAVPESAVGSRLSAVKLFWTTYFAAIIIPYAAYIVYVGGDWSVGRFFVPLLPLFYLLFSTGLVDMWIWLRGFTLQSLGTTAPKLGITGAILLAILLFSTSSWNGEYGIFIGGFSARTATIARETMGKWLRANSPPGTLIAVDAAGQVPYFSGLRAIDMFGINDWHIGRMNVATLGTGTPGHEKFDLGYVVARAPKYVVIYGNALDAVPEYERAPVTWTRDPDLLKFLTLYQRKE